MITLIIIPKKDYMKRAVTNKNFTYKQAIELRNELVWRNLSNTKILEAASAFLESLGSVHTKRAYQTSFDLFFAKGMLDPNMSLQTLSVMNLEHLIDLMRQQVDGSEATKQARTAAFISFTAFLQRRTGGMLRKVLANREKGSQTFKRIREKAYQATKQAIKPTKVNLTK